MILKVIRVEGLGRLRRLTPGTGVGQAGKLVGVYAENGAGKSTLVAAFRSVRNGSADPLRERRTLAPKTAQHIELLVEGRGTLKFDGAGWNETLPVVEVFDRAFVEATVHDGSQVGPDQRQQLFRLALGEGDAEAARRVDAAKAALQSADKALRAVEGRLQQRCADAGLTPDAVRAAAPISTPPDGHAQRVSRLQALGSDVDLATLARPARPTEPRPLDIGGLRKLLDSTAASVSAAAVEAVQRHVADHLDADGERWLRDGTRHAVGAAHCPYCQQDLEGSAFAQLLPAYFNASYAALQDRLARGTEAVVRWDAWLDQLRACETDNERARGAWSPYLELKPPPPLDVVVERARSFVTTLRDLLAAKSARPLDPLGADDRVHQLEEAHRDLSQNFEGYAAWAQALDDGIKRLLGSRELDLGALREQVSRERAQLVRGERQVQDDLAERERCLAGFSSARKEEEQAAEALAARESQRTDAFVDRVNGILRTSAPASASGISRASLPVAASPRTSRWSS